jgi:hypothetical protein
MHWDLPFGVLDPETSGVKWDTPLTESKFATLLRNFEAIQLSLSWFVSFNCDVTQAGMLIKALQNENYVHITPVCWYKEGQTKVANKQQLTPAFELMIVARKQRSGHAAFSNLADNPTERHNFISGPPQRTYLVDAKGQKVNPTQKPEYVFEWVLTRFAAPNLPVLICGTGAGGEVRAAMNLKIDVVGVERDPHQLEELYNSLVTHTTEKKLEVDRTDRKQKAAKAKQSKADEKKDGEPRDQPENLQPSPILAAAAEGVALPSGGKAEASPPPTSEASSSPTTPSTSETPADSAEQAEALPQPEDSAAKA